MTNTEVHLKHTQILACSSIAIFMGQYNNRREWEAVIQPLTMYLDLQHTLGVDRYGHISHRDPKEVKQGRTKTRKIVGFLSSEHMKTHTLKLDLL